MKRGLQSNCDENASVLLQLGIVATVGDYHEAYSVLDPCYCCKRTYRTVYHACFWVMHYKAAAYSLSVVVWYSINILTDKVDTFDLLSLISPNYSIERELFF